MYLIIEKFIYKFPLLLFKNIRNVVDSKLTGNDNNRVARLYNRVTAGDNKLTLAQNCRNKNVFRVAVEKVEKALQYAYRDRRTKKRNFRSLWIQRINAATRLHDMTYSRFMNGLTKAGIELDRKVLADIAVKEPETFAKLVDQVKASLSK